METSQIEKGNVLNLLDAINFADKSIVSKQIIKSSGGNVTLFAFDQNEGLIEHTAPFDALAIVIEGSSEIIIDKKTKIVNKGDFIIMPANIPHSLKAIQKFKMLLIMIKN
jgi:quercetin dioxygenase-like cupin family protein